MAWSRSQSAGSSRQQIGAWAREDVYTAKFSTSKQSEHDCRAKGQQCNRCNLIGHFVCSKLCKKKKQNKNKTRRVAQESESEEKEDKEEVKRVQKKLGKIGKLRKPEIENESCEEYIHIVTVTKKEEAVKVIPSKKKTPVSKLAVNSVPVRLVVDSGVRLTILNWSDWLKIQHTGAKPVSTNRSFVPYRMDSKLLIYARAKLTMQAKRGAVMQTNVYIMEDSQAESLVGRDTLGSSLQVAAHGGDGSTSRN